MRQVEFKGTLPGAYETYFRPILFDPYAKWLASRLSLGPGVRILEIAAGTGALTRELMNVLPEDGALVATDIQDAMLNLARKGTAADPRLTFREADALDLPFDDEAFDLVLCQFGYMFFPDKPKAMREGLRVLKARGIYGVLVWYPVEMNEVAQVPRSVISEFFGEPARAFDIPHGFADPEAIAGTMRDAGFSEIRHEDVRLIGRATAAGAAAGYCRGTPMGMEIEERMPGRVPEVEAAMKAAYAEHFGGEEFEHEMNAMYVEGVK